MFEPVKEHTICNACGFGVQKKDNLTKWHEITAEEPTWLCEVCWNLPGASIVSGYAAQSYFDANANYHAIMTNMVLREIRKGQQ